MKDNRKTGPEHWRWAGGVLPRGDGYLSEYVSPDDPLFVMADGRSYVLQHRLVVARALGRPLSTRETVHHINGIRSDNNLENLQLRQGQHGPGVVFACLDCGSHNVKAAPLP